MAIYVSVEPGDDAPTIITGGKYEGAFFADLALEELIALRRDPKVSRAAVEHELWRRRTANRRARDARRLLPATLK